jgi:hypothetical protein
MLDQQGPTVRSIIDTGRGYHLQSSEHENKPLTDLLIRCSPLSPSCPARSHIKPSTIYSKISTHSMRTNRGSKVPTLTSGTCHSTSTVVLSTKHSTTNGFHHDRIKDDIEWIIMHSRVSLNSYNINAQVNYKVIIVIKQKP